MTTPAQIAADLVERVQNNPASIHSYILDKVTEVSGGTMVFSDPSNPFVLGMEMVATMASAGMTAARAETRKQYPYLAQTEEDLYLHMSDKDYIGRWSTPSRATFTVAMAVDEIYVAAVPTGIGSMEKLVIPRHTEFTIADYTFTMQYPVEIRRMQHGGLQIVYDNSKPSPLQVLETNEVAHRYVTSPDRIKYLLIDIPVQQCKIKSEEQPMTAAQPYMANISFDGNFYACRAYHRNADDSEWTEIRVTETDQVYDPTVPTLAIKVFSDHIDAQIPQVYSNNGTVRNRIRVDVYTTEGKLDLILNSYNVENYQAKWRDLENQDGGIYSAPLNDRMTTLSVFSEGVAVGGSNPISFAQLRENVITGATGNQDIPITTAQIVNTLTTRGYQTIKNIDNITNRIFKAMREMPMPVDGSVSSPMGAAVAMLQASMLDLREYEAVIDNGDRITVTPRMLYRLVNGVVSPVPKYEIDLINSSPLETQATMINKGNFIFSPYHYVYDITSDSFDCRGYWLDNPEIASKSFIEENDTLLLEIGTTSYDIVRTETGYQLIVVAGAGPSVLELDSSQIHAQLAFKPVGEGTYAYLNGELQSVDPDSGEYIYTFDLTTNFDIDGEHGLHLSSFQMFGAGPRDLATKLLGDFELFYAVSDYFPADAALSDIDNILGKFILPDETVGIIQERFSIRLGDSLEGMWVSNRSVVGSEDYKRYASDVPWTYENTVYETDAQGNLVVTWDDEGKPHYNILHNKGDTVFNPDGTPAVRFYAGEIMRDGEGNPIPQSTRGMVRQVDMFFLEGLYWFATAQSPTEYRSTVSSTVVDWLKDDISNIRKILLEKSRLYFAPVTSLGNIEVMIEEGLILNMPSAQALQVDNYVTRNAYNDAELRRKLTENARAVIANHLGNAVVSIDDITTDLKTQAGTDVIAIEVTGLGDANDFAVVTLLDESMRCSVRKRIVALSDGTLTIEDAMDVNFRRHALNT